MGAAAMRGVREISNMIYVSELRAGLLDDICDQLYIFPTKIQGQQSQSLKKLLLGGSGFDHATYLVADLSALRDTTEEVVEAVSGFNQVYPDTRLIFLADREPSASPLCSRLFALGFYNLVRDLSPELLRKCLTSGMSREDAAAAVSVSPQPEPDRAQSAPLPGTGPLAQGAAVPAGLPERKEKITARKEWKKLRPHISVGVVGTQEHIGATHMAISVTKFLASAGFKAAYLEANTRRNLPLLARAYPTSVNEKNHLVQYRGVHMFFDFKLSDVFALGYDVYVFDLGRFNEAEPVSFLTKDIRIVVGGVKAWEIPVYQPVFDAVAENRNVIFAMNFAPERDWDGVRRLMGGFETYFTDYGPDPFAEGANLHIYKKVFADFISVEPAGGVPERTPEAGAKAKKGLFLKWR
jgi:hypothetical protein